MALHFSSRASVGPALTCVWVLVCAASAALPCRAAETQEVGGVVVESVAAVSSAAAAGIQPGDVLLSWIRRAPGDAKAIAGGRFQTVFDVRHFELEESQRPNVVVTLRRGTRTLALHLAQARWGVTVRPGFDTQNLRAYLDGKRLEDAQQVEAAIALWSPLADNWATAGRIDDAVWLLLRIAGAQKAGKDLPSAVQTFVRTERLATGLGPREEATAIEQHAQAVDNDAAEPLFQRALRLRRRQGGPTLSEASTLVRLGQLERHRDNFATARGYLERAVSIASTLAPGSLFHAQSLGQLAIVVGNDERSERLRREALAIVMRVAPNDGAAASITNGLAIFAARHGDNATAERLLRRTLAIDATGGYRDPMTVMNLGVVLGSRGNQIQSEQLLLESLALVRAKGDAGEVAGILQNLGMEALKRGDLDAAERYYMESLRIWQRTTPDRTGNAETLSALGEIAAQRGDLAAATDRFGRALAILQRMDGDMTSVLQNLADASLIAHDVKKAAEYTEAAHAANRNRANEQAAQTQVLRARIAEATADWKAADAAYAEAASLYRHSSPKAWGLVQCLRSRARVAIHLTQLDAAEAWLQEAISLVEAQRTRLAGDETQQAAFSRRSGAIFADLIDLMVTRAKITEAFNVLERYRAKSFLEHVAERDLLFADDIPDTLRRERIRAESEYDRARRELGSLDVKADAAAIVSARARLTAVGAVLANVQNRIRQASPRLAALQYPRPLVASEAAGALASGTALLTWSVGEERTHLFVLSSNAPAAAVFTIPVGAATVESRVRTFRSLLSRRRRLPFATRSCAKTRRTSSICS